MSTSASEGPARRRVGAVAGALARAVRWAGVVGLAAASGCVPGPARGIVYGHSLSTELSGIDLCQPCRGGPLLSVQIGTRLSSGVDVGVLTLSIRGCPAAPTRYRLSGSGDWRGSQLMGFWPEREDHSETYFYLEGWAVVHECSAQRVSVSFEGRDPRVGEVRGSASAKPRVSTTP